MERLKAFVKDNKKYIIFTAITWALFAALVYLSPYTGDDWAWGSKTGQWRIDTWFADYNGRYAGNLLVLLLTRSKLLQVLCISLSVVAICFLPLLFGKKKSLSMMALSAMLILLMPHTIFVQSIMWTSGYTNYLPSMIITIIYLSIAKGIYENEAPRYSLSQNIYLSLTVGAIAFVGALFMENVTIYNVILGAFVIIYAFVRHKKIYPVHISYLAFTLLGLFVMFSNGAYDKAAAGTDFYRGFTFGDYEKIFRHLSYICKSLFSDNLLLIGLISALCVAMLIKGMRSADDKKHKYLYLVILATNLFTLALICALRLLPSWQIVYGNKYASDSVFAAIVVLYCLSVLLAVIFLVRNRVSRDKLITLLCSVPLLVGPFIFISPLNARCLVPAYICLSVFAVMLFDYVRTDVNLSLGTVRAVTVSACAVAAGMLIFFFSIYSVIHEYSEMRLEYIKKQVDNGITTDVIYTHVPYEKYAWLDVMEGENWQKRFNEFYGINKNVRYKFVSVEEFESWRTEFDKTHSK